MIKRTPQEIADFFQAYVAMNESGVWYLYEEEPRIDKFKTGWTGDGCYCISRSLIKKDKTIDWKDSLCEPRKINSTSDGETDTQLIRMLSNMMIASICTHEYTKDLKKIADHYGKRELLERLLMVCAGMGVEVSRYLKGDSDNNVSFTGTIAELELLFEQVKYLMKIDPVDLGEIKKQKIAMHQFIIAQESHADSADNTRKVHEKSANEEE